MSDLTREQIEQSLYELQRELSVAKVDADHFFQLSGQYLERANKAEAKNIALTKAIENLKECLDQAEAEREALRVVK